MIQHLVSLSIKAWVTRLLNDTNTRPKTMNDLWQSAMQSLQTKRFDEASDLWMRVLVDSLNGAHQSCVHPVPRGPQQEVRLQSIPILTPGDIKPMESFSAHNQMILFDRVFALHGGGSQLTFYRPVIAMYNTALCMHLRALERPRDDSSRLLARAKNIYHLCLTTVGGIIQQYDQPTPSIVLLYLACLNNRGHIQSHLCEQYDVVSHILCVLQGLKLLYGQEQDTDPRVVSLEDVGGVGSSDLAFFLYFRFLPDSMIPASLSAAA